jgi:hypothetical protein
MTYKIGTRVKKVRGRSNVGVTGVVARASECIGNTCEYLTRRRGDLYDFYVRYDSSPIGYTGRRVPAGVWAASSRNWEPILYRHEPCETDFMESLDKLLSEVSREAV